MAKMHPSDVFIAFASEQAMSRTLIGELVVDFQGGGILSSAEAISYVSQPPIGHEIGSVSAIVDELMEAVTHLGPNWGLLHAVLYSACERNLVREGDRFSVTEAAVMETTINALCGLLERSVAAEDVVAIAAMGAVLMTRTETWESLR